MSVNSFVGDCPRGCKDTCLHNVSTHPPYHNLECWSCGWFSVAQEGIMTDAEKAQLKEDNMEVTE